MGRIGALTMYTQEIVWTPSVFVGFTTDELSALALAAHHHYDAVCKAKGAMLAQWMRQQEAVGQSVARRFDFRELDILGKVAEGFAVDHPCSYLLRDIAKVLQALSNAKR